MDSRTMSDKTMRFQIRIILLASILSITLLQAIEAAKDRKYRKDKFVENSQIVNICSNEDRNSRVHCYCPESKLLKNASIAECWVFNGGVPIDDSIWDGFQHQNRIQDLVFNVRADGGLEFVPTRALKYLRRLRKLTIVFADIKVVNTFAFANLTSLKELIVSKNRMNALEPYAFAHLLNLTTLMLEENRISEIGKQSFVDLPVLQKLNMSSNNISTIEGGAFKDLVQLFELDLRKNSISTLSKETFDGLANLKKLYLEHNRLRTLGGFTFMELWNLQELFLDSNELKFLHERTFDGLSQLKKLSLSRNRLTEITGGLFEGVRGLSYLDVSDNKLQTLTVDDVRPIWDNLKNTSSDLAIEGNPFLCDCRLVWMYSLRNDTKNERTRTTLEQVNCTMDKQALIENTITKHKSIENHYDYNIDNKLSPKVTHKVYDEKSTIHYVDADNPEVDSYDETQRDSFKNYGINNHTKRGQSQHLFKIPIEQLPCPEEMKDSTEAPLLRPSRGEVKDFRGFSVGSDAPMIAGNLKLLPLALLLKVFH